MCGGALRGVFADSIEATAIEEAKWRRVATNPRRKPRSPRKTRARRRVRASSRILELSDVCRAGPAGVRRGVRQPDRAGGLDCLDPLRVDGVIGKIKQHPAFRAMRGRCAIMDGEIVALDSEGRPQFYDPVFIDFDLLRVDNRNTRELPLIERKRPPRFGSTGQALP